VDRLWKTGKAANALKIRHFGRLPATLPQRQAKNQKFEG